ncbi:unnamed protein product [Pieris brassicae]|uniref:Uncharacterized protein n=1 Tax=Pieris brassicae TaxID=7116 RepID=A0A9P0TG15_PIEBR|nr:unnamed protein product [Pieris brassicae]
MGHPVEKTSSAALAKSASSAKKGSRTTGKKISDPINFYDPKVQGIILAGLLVVLSLALWLGFKNGCFGGRRRRRRHSDCSW